jgi:glycosyltransferase involved in cell wall biosynthesis
VKVVVAHDYLTQRGGAERVVLALVEAFPGSTVLTSMYAPDLTFPEFQAIDVRSLGLERFRPFRRDPRLALPVLGDAFGKATVDADVVICSSSGFSHQIRTPALKVVYCHNPPRWLHQWDDYSIDLGRLESLALRVLRRHLSRLDLEGARSADAYIANSSNVAGRIRRAYGVEPEVIHPPRGLDPDGVATPVADLAPGFLLTVGRSRGYKRTDLIAEAVAGMPDRTLVTVGSQPDPRWPSNIRQLVDVSDAELRWLYRSAAGLLACSREDFGLTPVEAFGFGTPVGATSEGGYLETCVEGLTGVWLDAESPSSLQTSIEDLLAHAWDRDAIRRHGAQWTTDVFRSNVTAAVVRLFERRGGTSGEMAAGT